MKILLRTRPEGNSSSCSWNCKSATECFFSFFVAASPDCLQCHQRRKDAVVSADAFGDELSAFLRSWRRSGSNCEDLWEKTWRNITNRKELIENVINGQMQHWKGNEKLRILFFVRSDFWHWLLFDFFIILRCSDVDAGAEGERFVLLFFAHRFCLFVVCRNWPGGFKDWRLKNWRRKSQLSVNRNANKSRCEFFFFFFVSLFWKTNAAWICTTTSWRLFLRTLCDLRTFKCALFSLWLFFSHQCFCSVQSLFDQKSIEESSGLHRRAETASTVSRRWYIIFYFFPFFLISCVQA